jgi:hypothetical protein
MASVASQLMEEVTAHAQSDSLEDAREICADGTYFLNNPLRRTCGPVTSLDWFSKFRSHWHSNYDFCSLLAGYYTDCINRHGRCMIRLSKYQTYFAVSFLPKQERKYKSYSIIVIQIKGNHVITISV